MTEASSLTWCKIRSSTGKSSSQNSQGSMMFEEGLWPTVGLVLGEAAVQLLLVLEESWEVRLLGSWCPSQATVPHISPHALLTGVLQVTFTLQAEGQHVVQTGGLIVWQAVPKTTAGCCCCCPALFPDPALRKWAECKVSFFSSSILLIPDESTQLIQHV